MPVEEKIKSLTEALAWETRRREAVERLAVDAFKRRRELEAELAKNQEAEKALQVEMAAPDEAKRRRELGAELAENKRTQARLRQELEASQKQLQAQKENYLAEQARLEAGIDALQAPVEEKGKGVTEALAGETRGREGAERPGGG